VLRDVLAGKCQAGATYSGALLNAVTQGVEVSGLRQVALTGHSPQDASVAGPTVAPEAAEQLLEALRSYKPQTEHLAGSVERISGFVPARPEDHASIRELVQLESGPKP
jgi:ABC-type phosphate/phosphonate transport system substrate-binding protein